MQIYRRPAMRYRSNALEKSTVPIFRFEPHRSGGRGDPFVLFAILFPCTNVARGSHPTRGSRQLGPVETQFFTRSANDTSLKNLVRAAQRHLRLPSLTMNHHVRMASAPLLLVSVEAATMLGQPFPKRRLSIDFLPVPILQASQRSS